MLPTLRVYLPLCILVTMVSFVYSIFRLSNPIAFAIAFMVWMTFGMQRVFGPSVAARSMRDALRGIVMALVWPLIPKRFL